MQRPERMVEMEAAAEAEMVGLADSGRDQTEVGCVEKRLRNQQWHGRSE